MDAEPNPEKLKLLREELERGPENFCENVLGLREEVSRLRDNLQSAECILSAVLDCGTLDLECIYDVERNHSGTVDRALELKDELGSINFGNFVMGAKDQSISEVEDEISEADAESFRDLIIDDNYVAWGGVAAYGSYRGGDMEENQRRQELFASFVNGSLSKDKFLEEYREFSAESSVKSGSAAEGTKVDETEQK